VAEKKKNGVHGQINGEVCFWGEQFLAEYLFDL
jgi:hypothetical protein